MTEWHNYVKRFYRLSPHEQQSAWAQLTPEQQSAFRAAYEAGFRSDQSTTAQPEPGMTYAEAAEVEAAAWKKRIGYTALAVGLSAVAAILFFSMLASMDSRSTRSDYSYRPPRSYTSAVSPDIRQARAFLASLPSECGSSSMSVAGDGTVTIYVRCPGHMRDGTVTIKNGIVRDIR